jgi:hypothetical protein
MTMAKKAAAKTGRLVKSKKVKKAKKTKAAKARKPTRDDAREADGPGASASAMMPPQAAPLFACTVSGTATAF